MAAQTSSNNTVAASAAATRAARIAALNDALRRTFNGGWVMISAGVSAQPEATRSAVLTAVLLHLLTAPEFAIADRDPRTAAAINIAGDLLVQVAPHLDIEPCR